VTRALVLLGLVLPLAGCTVSAVDVAGNTQPTNSCATDDDCGKQNHCSAGICQTLAGQLEGLLISATPPSDSVIPHMTFTTDVTGVPTSGGTKDLLLAGPAQVHGSFVLPDKMTCYPNFLSDDQQQRYLPAIDGRSLPVTVTLVRRESLRGLSQQIYVVSTSIIDAQGDGGYTFDVQVPAGTYDVYLVPPHKQKDGTCKVPPQLYRDAVLDKPNATYPFALSPISKLTLDVRRNKNEPKLDGWIADIIEPVGGNSISTEVVLSEPTDSGEASPVIDYKVALAFSTVQPPPDPSSSQSDLVRLRPPDGVIAPTVFLARSAFGLFAADPTDVAADVDSLTHYPAPVEVEGQLRRRDDGMPVGGSVSLLSTQLTGMGSGVFGSFQTNASVGASGDFRVTLPPGNYRVLVVPPSLGGADSLEQALSPVDVTWMVPPDISPQFGKLIELPPIKRLTGQSRVEGAQVQAVASPSQTIPFVDAFGGGPVSPRATSGLVDSNGRFALPTDPGLFDVSVEAPDTLGFAWFVRPGVQVQKEKDEDLGRVTLPAPSLLTGVASLPGDIRLASASIRAYAYLDANLQYTRDPKQAASVIQVAETRAKEDGSFRLLVPSSITAPK
jgi:hypothetical protein